jgi:hypothetical protein
MELGLNIVTDVVTMGSMAIQYHKKLSITPPTEGLVNIKSILVDFLLLSLFSRSGSTPYSILITLTNMPSSFSGLCSIREHLTLH